MVTEGASTSAWIVDAGGTLRTRPLGHAILPGCTRDALMRLLREHGIAFEERPVQRGGAARRARGVPHQRHLASCKPITAVDGAPVGDGGSAP